MDLQNLIIQFTYQLPSLSFLNDLAIVSFVNSKNLPVPRKWKYLLKTNEDLTFHWDHFLQSNMQPYSLRSLVDLQQVRETVRYLNWNYLKLQQNLAAHVIACFNKKKLLKKLTTWCPTTHKLIFQIQRLLTCIDLPQAKLRSLAFDYERFVIQNPNPLCMYISTEIHTF